jgi:hypothetical protein
LISKLPDPNLKRRKTAGRASLKRESQHVDELGAERSVALGEPAREQFSAEEWQSLGLCYYHATGAARCMLQMRD